MPQEGDHVKVVAGQMAGETGMLLRLDAGVATLFLDSSRQEVKLFSRDLTESADIVAGIDRWVIPLQTEIPSVCQNLPDVRSVPPDQGWSAW